jgi:hypothetical protein
MKAGAYFIHQQYPTNKRLSSQAITVMPASKHQQSLPNSARIDAKEEE